MGISVIIPVYNSEKTLRRCLDSLVMQMRDQDELIIVNDGSQDNSEEICLEYQNNYKKVKYIAKENGGVSTARNTGLSAASEDYICFVDSDDYVSENYFTTLSEQPDVDFLFFSAQFEQNAVTEGKIVPGALADVKTYSDFVKEFIRMRNGSPWNKRFRKEIIVRNRIQFPTDLNIGEDYVFCIRFLMAAKSAAAVDTVLYHVDESDGNSLSRKYNRNVVEQALHNYEYCNQEIQASSFPEDVKRELLRWQSHNRYRTAFACVLELLKKERHSYWLLRPEILSVLKSFHSDENGITPVNTRHSLMRLCVEHRWTVLAYVLAWIRYVHKKK